MYKRNQSHHIPSNYFTSSLDLSRRISIRRRLIERKQRIEQSQESNNISINKSIRNTVSIRPRNNDENNSLISNQTLNNTISTPSKIKNKKSRKYSLYLSEKTELKKIEEEKPKEENINSEIKDTVKCYICFGIVNKPKMCQFCHRIACEKCLYNWFINENNNNCAYCNTKINFNEMISVPFMSTVADFVEKIFDKENNNDNDNNKNIFCPNHSNEQIYYYCLDCNRGYCKICFVFFGKEKDKHVKHNIIKYEQYKNFQFENLKKFEDKITEKINETNDNIKLCESFKEEYEYERKKGNDFFDNLKNEFNKYINDNLTIIDNHIKSLKDFISKYDKYKTELHNFYSNFSNKKINKNYSNNFFQSQRLSYELINKFSTLSSEKTYSKNDIEKLFDLSKEIKVYSYQTKSKDFNLDNLDTNNNLKFGDSPYELQINKKQEKEIIINLLIQKNQITYKHNFNILIFVKIKENEIKSMQLNQINEDDKFIYFKKTIPWDYLGQSSFIIKGIMYDFYFV